MEKTLLADEARILQRAKERQWIDMQVTEMLSYSYGLIRAQINNQNSKLNSVFVSFNHEQVHDGVDKKVTEALIKDGYQVSMEDALLNEISYRIMW
ncbi:hypothetical protein [uncultured Veillonella sp.]|uniref:hypothetical protein n=1 Tax=uncultured Veillonella sp. TaxID=159268 RepID=UPI0025EE92A2|nr:hypothetical protein [uncultured Veillonella sp.]